MNVNMNTPATLLTMDDDTLGLIAEYCRTKHRTDRPTTFADGTTVRGHCVQPLRSTCKTLLKRFATSYSVPIRDEMPIDAYNHAQCCIQ